MITQKYFVEQFLFVLFLMSEGEIFKIDESVKVSSWNVQGARQVFDRYAEDQTEAQVVRMEVGFRKLKNEQIEKLKDLRSQYQEIKKITTDYAAPRASRTPSMSSSNLSRPAASNTRSPQPARELQIVELQKKQLEIMVQNSMKKIEELLHNQMQYKKTIHELKLQKESRATTDLDGDGLSKLLRRKEKEFTERTRALQLEREGLLSSVTSSRDRIKYLQSNLSASEQQLRKMLQEKRNFQELLRMQKDKYLNLQIQFRREKRQHEIIQKDKNAQINRLIKVKQVISKTSSNDLSTTITSLKEQIAIKDQRYVMLLNKFESIQKQLKQRQRGQKDNQSRMVELLSKSTSLDPQNKAIQQTITGILNRLTDLEKKPIIQIDHIVNHQHEEHSEIVQRLQNKITQLGKIQQEKQALISQLEAENYSIKNINQKLERDLKKLSDYAEQLREEIQRLRKLEKSFKKDRSTERLQEIKSKVDPFYNSFNSGSNQFNKALQVKVNLLNSQIENLKSEKIALEQENRTLRQSINRLQFQVEKGVKEKQFSLSLQEKNYQKKVEDLQILNSELKKQIYEITQSTENEQKSNLSKEKSYQYQINTLKTTIQSLRKQRSNVDTMVKQNLSTTISKLQEENTLKLNDLTIMIQKLTTENQRLQNQRQQFLALADENQRLVELLRRSRNVSAETDRLWNAKEQEYEIIDGVLASLRK